MPMIFTAESVKPQLMEANKDYLGRNTWNQMFSEVALDTGLAKSSLNNQYGNAINEAYIASLANKNAIQSSNLGQGYKKMALNENERALDDAFESYKINYLNSKNEIDATEADAVNQINSAIDSQATNVAAYANAAFDYLPWLYKQDESLFNDNVALQRFLDYNVDEAGKKSVKGLKDIRSMMFNEDGSLNELGIDYMNMVQGLGATGNLPAGTSFTDFMMQDKANKQLLEWLNSADPYSAGKSNMDTFNEIVGSHGNAYQLTKQSFDDSQWSNVKSDYESTHETLLSEYEAGHKSEKDAVSFMNKQSEATNKLISLAEQLGVIDDEAVKVALDKAKKGLSTYSDAVVNPGKGNNRKNREWATSNALADYEELYDAVMKAYDSTGLESFTERAKDYETRKAEREESVKLDDYVKSAYEKSTDYIKNVYGKSTNYMKNAYEESDLKGAIDNKKKLSEMTPIRDVMKSYDSGEIDDSQYSDALRQSVYLIDDEYSAVNRYVNGDVFSGYGAPSMTIDYKASGKGLESVNVSWNLSLPLDVSDSEFKKVHSYSRDSGRNGVITYDIGTSSDGTPVIRYQVGNDYKYYKLNYTNTKDNRIFGDYLKHHGGH